MFSARRNSSSVRPSGVVGAALTMSTAPTCARRVGSLSAQLGVLGNELLILLILALDYR
jgi:hypothetical protein